MGSSHRSHFLETAILPYLKRLTSTPRVTRFGLFMCLAALMVGADPTPSPSTPKDPAVLQALTRTLEEEVRLASKPQPYLLLDLSRPILLLKSRGLILREFSILHWRSSRDPSSISTYRLRTRPPVSRPKIRPGQDSTEHPIDVYDMPMDYLLAFDRGFVVEVSPPFAERPWHWLKRKWLSGWSRFKTWIGQESGEDLPMHSPQVNLILSQEEAQALAWTVTEGMPLLIGRTEQP